MDVIWRSDETIFNYDTDMSSFAASKAFAKETWNRQFFQDLEKAHQTHYEQMGRIDGELIFHVNQAEDNKNGEEETKEIITLHMPSFRDHSYGKS